MRAPRIARLVAIALVAGLAAPRAAETQPVNLTPGARLRVSAPDFDIKRRTGTLVRVTPDSLTVDFRGRIPPMTLPIDGLSRLDVSTGKRRAAGLARGAAIGTLIGALAGLAISGDPQECRDEGCGAVILGTLGGGTGLILGSVIGVATAPDRWKEASLRGQSSALRMLKPGPTTRVGLSIPF